MRRLVRVAFLLIYLSQLSLAQAVKPDITTHEEQEAKTVAVAFFNRFRETRDITPLLREFFVSDFERRLEYCRTSSNCTGFARDFWKPSENLVELKATRKDFVRHYAAIVNVLYLGAATMNHLARKAKKTLEEFSDDGQRILEEELKRTRNTEALDSFRLLYGDGLGDNAIGVPKSLSAFRDRIKGLEALAAALRTVEEKARNDLKTGGIYPYEALTFKSFSVGDEVNTRRFFDYSVGTKLIEVWPKNAEPPFKIDMIAEGGRLRIVAIYPPMD